MSSREETAILTFDFLDRMHQTSSLAEANELFARLVSHWGITSWVGGRVSSRSDRISDPVHPLFGQPPALWSARYLSAGYVHDDPVVKLVLRAEKQFRWGSAYPISRFTAREKHILGEAAEFGLTEGVVVPFRTFNGSIYSVSMGGSHIDPSPHVLDAIGISAQAYAGRCLYLLRKLGNGTTRLTDRQRTSVQLVRDGLSNEQAARVMKISTKAIEYHLAEARRRLQAKTRLEMIVSAIALGEIS